MAYLETVGARLHYSIAGSGPTLLFVPGGNGTGVIFHKMAEALQARFTTITYDRRGFSNSTLIGEPDYSKRLETDADDARALIELADNGPAIICGNSSGGVVTLQLLLRHPEVVSRALLYEPACVRLLEDGDEWVRFYHEMYDRYRSLGVQAALDEFRRKTFVASDAAILAKAQDTSRDPSIGADIDYWFEHEVRQYPATFFDREELLAYRDRIVPVVGVESRGFPTYRTSEVISHLLDVPMVEVPGGHVGMVTHPVEFAESVSAALD